MFVLKHNDSFAILDEKGDMLARHEAEDDIADGLICRDTRLLSRLHLQVNGQPPQLVDSSIGKYNESFEAHLTPHDAEQPEIWRTIFVWNDALYQETAVINHSGQDTRIDLSYYFDADFKDLFELRGAQRPATGAHHSPTETDTGLVLSYTGLDNATRHTYIAFSEVPDSRDGQTLHFTLDIPSGETRCLYTRIGSTDTPVTPELFDVLKAEAQAQVQAHLDRRVEIESSNAEFDDWVHQNAVDIALLTTETPTGLFPYAGIPWYSTAFGRDALITAFQLLWQDPDIAKGVLSYLATHQATETDTFHDSAPGKIMHEIRQGEMAACGEIPHTPYYGTADATPLFVFLAGAYLERTGDIAFIRDLWPHIDAALWWMTECGDKDGDGFIEYQRGADTGLGNQGWKDSQDCISHADGTLAEGAIALCEVQGYAYAARHAAATMAAALGMQDRAAELLQSAENLKASFNDVFWNEDMGTYALALDGDKKPCLVRTSNAGHLLFCGIVPDDRAVRVAEALMADDMFTGFGIRTLSSNEKRYEPIKNPEGYHNGTVWTHDTALCAAGMAKYGMEDKAAKLLSGLFDAAKHFPQMRLPELFGGLPRNSQSGEAPAPYPVACNPQAWASASESLLLQSMLGLKIDGQHKRVTIDNPRLPVWLAELSLHGLRIGDSSLSLKFQRHDDGVDITVTGSTADIDLHLPAQGDISADAAAQPKKHGAS